MVDIKEFINQELNAQMKVHSAKTEFVELVDHRLKIKLMGGCSGCPSSLIALFNNVVPIIKEKYPDIKEVELAV